MEFPIYYKFNNMEYAECLHEDGRFIRVSRVADPTKKVSSFVFGIIHAIKTEGVENYGKRMLNIHTELTHDEFWDFYFSFKNDLRKFQDNWV